MQTRTSELASEPIHLCSLELHYPPSDLAQLQLPDQDLEAAESRVQSCLSQIHQRIDKRELDPDFSVAIRERWQAWSRTSKPYKAQVVSGQTSKSNPSARQHTGEDGDLGEDKPGDEAQAGEDEEDEDEDDQDDGQASQPRIRGHQRSQSASQPSRDLSTAASSPEPTQAGLSPSSAADDGTDTCRDDETEESGWDATRRAREALLQDMDHAVPNAFRFSHDQMVMFSSRMRSKNINSLERPFTVEEIRENIHVNSMVEHEAPKATLPSPQVAERMKKPLVLEISTYWSSPHVDEMDEASSLDADEEKAMGSDRDKGFTRPSVSRKKGTGPLGMKKSQTIEVLSNQAVGTVAHSLICWSDDLPERVGWQQRLRDTEATLKRTADGTDDGDEADENGQEMRFAGFTGRKRQTDMCMVIEGQLYGHGMRVGEEPWEADYATLLRPYFENSTTKDMSVPFDELSSIRVGQSYWILHQGDCVHCFTVDSIRALRPEEEAASAPPPSQALATTFPRTIWLSSSALFRFAAENQDGCGIGHRILSSKGLVVYQHKGTGAPTTSGSVRTQARAWTSQGRAQRKDESMLRTKFGKCYACQIRKSQIGIVGGERVRINEMRGMDDQIVSLCPQCAVTLGLAQESEEPSFKRPKLMGEDIEIDWPALNAAQDGWTVFPLY